MKPERERRNSMSEQKKLTKQNNILWIIVAVVVIAFCAYSFLTSDLEHIEDTNGLDNYALAVITDEDIVKQEMGALNVGLSKDVFASGVTCSSSKFTGVYRVFQTNFLFNSDFRMDLLNFHVQVSTSSPPAGGASPQGEAKVKLLISLPLEVKVDSP